MPTGLQILERTIETHGEAIGFLGKTDALASATDRLRDAARFDMRTLPTGELADAFVLITGTSNSDRGLVAKQDRIDPSNGDLIFDPAAGAAIVSGCKYALLRWGIRPDDYFRSRDRALEQRCSIWRYKPLSVLPDVEDWSVAAYDATLGGEQSSAGAVQTLDFPSEIAEESMLVTNSGADGNLSSRSLYVQPNQTYRLFGRVSARAQTASVRVRDITNTADITLQGRSTFTLRGWQWFEVTFQVPAGCGELQVWLGGASASCISDWMLVGLLPMDETLLSLQSRVLSPHDVGIVRHVFFEGVGSGTTTGNQRIRSREITDVKRLSAGDGVNLQFEGGAPGFAPVYYRERHRYAALQTDYYAKSDRTTGFDASTDCPLPYVVAASVVELLEPRAARLNAELQGVLRSALKELRVWERRVGADPFVAYEPREGARSMPSLYRL